MITGDDKTGGRPVRDEEQALWQAVTRTVAPLKHRRRKPESATAPKPAVKARRAASPAAGSVRARESVKPKEPPKEPPQKPALVPLDRRAKQKLARGTRSVDARLDLHGRSQSQAHAALLHFLRQARSDGAKTVLVITGKGGGLDSERGVLKRQVPLWLALPEFRDLVIGFGAAAISHGGEGALYVRIRRAR
jgi:DNA-nicking Smr family endonuclease